jgi:hypothetical protein
LESDEKFFASFANMIELHGAKDYWVKTQVVYKFGRPDIEIYIKSTNTIILIECKIEHFERANQLYDYCKILHQKKCDQKHLIYITKYYDHKDITQDGIKFCGLKWTDIYDLIYEDNNQITKQLKQYIKEQNMAESNNFNFQDLAHLTGISATISKMDEVLDGVKSHFEKNIGNFSKDSSRSTRLKNEHYVNYHVVQKDKKYLFAIQIGFFWWGGELSLALRIHLPNKEKNKETSACKSIFDTSLKGWYFEEWEEAFSYWHYAPLAKFIIDHEEQVPAMITFLKEGIDDLAKLKIKDANIFG